MSFMEYSVSLSYQAKSFDALFEKNTNRIHLCDCVT